MNTATTLHDDVVPGAHRPHDLLAPCAGNIRTVERLEAAMLRIRDVQQKLQPPIRLVSAVDARERLIDLVRSA